MKIDFASPSSSPPTPPSPLPISVGPGYRKYCFSPSPSPTPSPSPPFSPPSASPENTPLLRSDWSRQTKNLSSFSLDRVVVDEAGPKKSHIKYILEWLFLRCCCCCSTSFKIIE